MNKLRYNVSFWLGALFLFVTGGCSDYFDVRPKSQVLADELFSTEEGFSDQLTGVYKRLASTSLYGQEMTFGLAEALTQNYDLATGSEYYEAGLYNYENTAVKNKITTVWSQMYSAIANLNIMLEYIDKNPAMFGGDNYRIYKGEALGLRAFLHLDLLRMFAPSYASNAQAPAIPYVMTYSTAVTPQSTVDKVLDYVIADAREALGLLETDPLFLADSLEAYTYRNDRSYRFNFAPAGGVCFYFCEKPRYSADIVRVARYLSGFVCLFGYRSLYVYPDFLPDRGSGRYTGDTYLLEFCRRTLAGYSCRTGDYLVAVFVGTGQNVYGRTDMQ